MNAEYNIGKVYLSGSLEVKLVKGDRGKSLKEKPEERKLCPS